MDSGVRDSKVNPIGDLEVGEEPNLDKAGKNDDEEEESLLVPKDGGCNEQVKKTKTKRKVQWNDTNGHKLAEIIEFLPSDNSDSEDDDSDFCFCIIM